MAGPTTTAIKGNQINLKKTSQYPVLYDGQPRWTGTTLYINEGGVDVAVAGGGGAFSNKQIFTSSGTFTATFTGMHKIIITGGGGGGSSAAVGAGGSAGATAIFWTNLTSGVGYSVVVGAGGATDADGSNSTFNDGITTATGGKGLTGFSLAIGAAGGTATNGTINIRGGDGTQPSNAGGSPFGGSGGASFWGGGGSGGNSSNGQAGKVYGAGGGGGGGTAGVGFQGIVTVEW